MRNKLEALIASAMKNGDKDRLDVLRLIKTDLVKKEKDGIDITDAIEANILNKMVAQREDSIKQFKEAGRTDLVENEAKQLIILKEYAPKEVSEEEIRRITEQMIIQYLDTKDKEYILSMKDMKGILSLVQEVHQGASGKIISQIIQEQIKK